MTELTEANKKIKISPELLVLYNSRNALIIEREFQQTCYNHHSQIMDKIKRELLKINTQIAFQEAKENDS